MTTLDNTVLSFSSVSKTYEKRGSLLDRRVFGTTVIEDLTFSVREGELVGLIGINGAGKSTILKIAAGVVQPSGGSVRVLGSTRFSSVSKRNIGYLIGARSRLIWDLPPIETFQLHRSLYGIARDDYHSRLEELASNFSLSDLLEKPVRTLSLGQRMRCEIALCFLHRPRLLLLDEATLSLDSAAKQFFTDGVRAASSKFGTAVLFASNEMVDVERTVDRMLVLHNRRIVFDGPTREVISTFGAGDLVIVRFAGGVDRRGLLHSLLKQARVTPQDTSDELQFELTARSDTERQLILKELAPHLGEAIETIVVVPETLESVVKRRFSTEYSL